MIKRIIIKGLPLILLLVLLQPALYFTLAWFRDWQFSGIVKTLTILIILAAVWLLRYLSPFLEKLSSRVFLLAMLVIFAVSRLIWMIGVQTLPISDFNTYQYLAEILSRGGLMQGPAVDSINGWGYPLFLGLLYRIFGISLTAAKLANLVFGLLTVWLVFWLANEMAGKQTARWATLLFVFWPAELFYINLTATEHLALPLILGGSLLILRALQGKGRTWLNALFGGGLVSLGAITRPTAVIYLFAVVLVWIVVKRPLRQTIVRSLAVVGGYLLIYAIFLGGVYLLNNKIMPNTTYSLSMNLYMGSNVATKGMWIKEDIATILTWPKDQTLSYSIQASYLRLAPLTPRQWYNFLAQKNYIFWAEPYYGLSWSTQNLANPEVITALPYRELESSQYLFQLFLLLAAAVGCLRCLVKGYSPEIAVALLVLLLGMLANIMLVVDSRYLFIFQPLLGLVAGLGLVTERSEESAVRIATGSHQAYTEQRVIHWDALAQQFDARQSWGRFYHRRLAEIYGFLVSPGQRVLEIGCGQGNLLAAVKPTYGVGIDFSSKMISRAREQHPEQTFYQRDGHNLALDEKFDVVLLSDLVNDIWDVQTVLQQVAQVCTPGTRIIINFYSRIWEPVLIAAEKLGLVRPVLAQNWLTVNDINNLLYLSGFEPLRSWREILLPLPILGFLFNRFLAKIWPFHLLDLTNFVIARPRAAEQSEEQPLVSVIVPARNEAGNVQAIFERAPEMGAGTELIFVEGHSSDNTFEAIQAAIQAHPERRCKLYRQDGKGKGDAVRKGFAAASGDVLMILDADLTVPPEDLPRFYEALVFNKGEMINGVRLVYPMEKEAMHFANLVGNRFFSISFSWLLGQPIKDTLCGTKVLWKADYERIAANRAYFGDFDPFGDYDLLFGAARQNLKIIDLPIRYRERVYGTTNIQRWRHGMILLRMTAFAAIRLKFV